MWSIEDVQAERPDLSDNEAWLVLQDVDDSKDAEFGITWETIQLAAEQRYPTL